MNQVSATEAFDKLKPESCGFVISVDESHRPNGTSIGWFMKCSIEPPLVAIAVAKSGNTHRLIEYSKEFVLAIANKELESDLKYFGSRSGDSFDKFSATGIKTIPANYVNSPMLSEATVNLECFVEQQIDSGDHFIFIGKVLAAHVQSDKKVLFNIGKVGAERYFQEY